VKEKAKSINKIQRGLVYDYGSSIQTKTVEILAATTRKVISS
jgi:hypothetical protein